MLFRSAVRLLSDGLRETLDFGGQVKLTERPYLEKLWTSPKLWSLLQKIPLLGRLAKSELSNNLALSYDIAKGFVVAQEEVSKLVDGLATEGGDKENGNNELVELVKKEITTNRLRGLHFLKGIREANPEITAAIETKHAIRSMLNHERTAINKLQHQGRIEDDEAQKIIASVEGRMKKLMDSPPSFKLPDSHDLLNEITWLNGLDSDTLEKVKNKAQDKIYQQGVDLMKKGDPGNGLFVIARGSVKVTVGEIIQIGRASCRERV